MSSFANRSFVLDSTRLPGKNFPLEEAPMAEQPTDRVTIRENIVFGTGGGRDLRCDIFEPPASVKNGIGILIVHGGGWSQGDRTQLRGYGILLGRRGYTCVASEYRLTGEALWPAQIEDVKAAIRWMRANVTSLGIDPSRIVIEGNSAGAHLALLAAGTPGRAEFEGSGGNAGVSTAVCAAIAFYAPTKLDKPALAGLPNLFGTGAPLETIRAASPVTHAAPDFPPTLLIHGTTDEIVSPGDSVAMYDALRTAGAPVELHMFAGQPHGFDADPGMGRLSADLMLSFLDRFVVSKA